MNATICGHDRDRLIFVLERADTCPGECDWKMVKLVYDPEKLAAIIAELLGECTRADVVVFSPGPNGIIAGRTPSRLDYVVYWDRDHGGTIQVKTPCGPDDADHSRLLVMQQARAFALRLLDETTTVTAQCIDRLLGDIR